MNNDLISRQAIIKDIQDLLKSPYGKDDNIGRVYKRDMAETIIDLCVKNQSTVNQWIDVKDRLPQKETYVLVCFDDGFIATVFFGEDFELWLDSGEPIAWMLLPEPYKKEVE